MPRSPSVTSASPQLPDAKLRLIHVARRQLGLMEGDYRAILGLYGGASSATMLDQVGFTAVMDRFRELGFRSTSSRRPLPARVGMASPGQVQLIRRLWAEFTDGEGSDATLGKWLERTLKVSALPFVTADLAFKAIGALKSMTGKRRPQLRPERGPRAA
jgi:hypothetical protein